MSVNLSSIKKITEESSKLFKTQTPRTVKPNQGEDLVIGSQSEDKVNSNENMTSNSESPTCNSSNVSGPDFHRESKYNSDASSSGREKTNGDPITESQRNVNPNNVDNKKRSRLHRRTSYNQLQKTEKIADGITQAGLAINVRDSQQRLDASLDNLMGNNIRTLQKLSTELQELNKRIDNIEGMCVKIQSVVECVNSEIRAMTQGMSAENKKLEDDFVKLKIRYDDLRVNGFNKLYGFESNVLSNDQHANGDVVNK